MFEIGEGEHKRKCGSRPPTSRRGAPKLMFQIFLLGAEPFVKDALAIFLNIKRSL